MQPKTIVLSAMLVLFVGANASDALACKGGSGGNGGGNGTFKLNATVETPYDPGQAYPAYPSKPIQGGASSSGVQKPLWTQNMWFDTPPNTETGRPTRLKFKMTVNSSNQGTFPFSGLEMIGPTGDVSALASGTMTVSGHNVTLAITSPYSHTWSFSLPRNY